MQAFFDVVIRFILEVVFEIGLRLPGALICKCLMPNSDFTFDSLRVILVGVGFWAMIGFVIWMIYA